MNDERFFDLAMKAAAGQYTDAERAELDALLAKRPELKPEFERLQAEARLAREALPLVAATEATAGEFPAYARGRLQSKVRQTYGRTESKEAAEAKPNWLWLRWLAFAGVAAALVALLVPLFVTSDRLVIQVAMVDSIGSTRGAGTNDVATLQRMWRESPAQVFTNAQDVEAWEKAWPGTGKGRFAKIIHDRAAAEVRVIGRRDGTPFEKTFTVERDLASTLAQAKAFLEEQLRRQ